MNARKVTQEVEHYVPLTMFVYVVVISLTPAQLIDLNAGDDRFFVGLQE